MTIRIPGRIQVLVVASLAAVLLYNWNSGSAGFSGAHARDITKPERNHYWHILPDSNFAVYLEAFTIPANYDPRLLEVAICRYLDGHHHLSKNQNVGGLPQLDVYCEFRVAGHVTVAHVATLQQ
ncbi:MAG: hypothetical protein V3T39_08935 [Gammaproteobacteria bacterium]